MTRKLPFVTLDVFTDVPFGGNPLAVFTDAPDLSVSTMQAIAAELNLSETVFVTARGATIDLRIFTPKSELPFAGHPTVGAAAVLAAESGEELIMRVPAGLVRATVSAPADGVRHATVVSPRPPSAGPAIAPEIAAKTIGLAEEDLAAAPWVFDVGVAFSIIPVRDRATLARCAIHMAAWSRWFAPSGAASLHVVTLDDFEGGDTVYARNFAPGVGISEDPATGAAAVALTGWLQRAQQRPDGRHRWTVHQGVEMGRPSRITIEATVLDGDVIAANLGGSTVAMSRGVLFV